MICKRIDMLLITWLDSILNTFLRQLDSIMGSNPIVSAKERR